MKHKRLTTASFVILLLIADTIIIMNREKIILNKKTPEYHYKLCKNADPEFSSKHFSDNYAVCFGNKLSILDIYELSYRKKGIDIICPKEMREYAVRYDFNYRVHSDSFPKINKDLIHDLDSIFGVKTDLVLVDTVRYNICRIENGKKIRAIEGGGDGWRCTENGFCAQLYGTANLTRLAEEISKYSGLPVISESQDNKAKYRVDTLIVPKTLPVDEFIDSLEKQGIYLAKVAQQLEHVRITNNMCLVAIPDGLFRYSPEQMKKDADFFFSTIEKYHINPYYVHGKKAYKKKKKAIYEQLNTCMIKKEFQNILSSINSFLDPHTRVQSVLDTYHIEGVKHFENTGEKIFPDIIYREKKYFTNVEGKEKEINSINGLQISILNDSLDNYISDWSPNMRKLIIEGCFPFMLPVFFNIHPPYNIDIEEKTEVWAGISIDSSRAYKQAKRKIKACSYSVYPKSSIAILYFNTLDNTLINVNDFDLKMRELSDSLRFYHIDNLFIDLSKNTGGAVDFLPLLFGYFQHETVFFNPREVYKRIPKKTKNPDLKIVSKPVKNDSLFDGKLWILQGTRTYSGGDILCRIIGQNRLGVRFGQQTSQHGKTYCPCINSSLPYSCLRFNYAFGYWEFKGYKKELLEPDMYWEVDDTYDFAEEELAAMLDAWANKD